MRIEQCSRCRQRWAQPSGLCCRCARELASCEIAARAIDHVVRSPRAVRVAALRRPVAPSPLRRMRIVHGIRFDVTFDGT